MAFRAEDYHPKWSLIRRLILRRAAGRCEGCQVENNRLIKRNKDGSYRYATGCELIWFAALRRGHKWHYWRSLKYLGLTRISTAVAHLDRDRYNNRFDNLKAYCQRCHLLHDLPQHVRNRHYGRYHDREHQAKLFDQS
jgi:hypothetical protein